MYRRFQDRFGTAGVIVAVVALIAALSGTALAASGALTGKQKKEVEKIAKKYAGKPGANGPAGANGTAGKDGTNGTNGKDGTNGTNGSPGAPGKSVEVSKVDEGEVGPEEECEELGAVVVKVQGAATAKEACNGKQGAPGPKGSPWTAGGTLPAGATETGGWSFNGTEAGGEVRAPISFSIPLAKGLEEEHVHYQTDSNFNATCKGTIIEPSAPSGELCVYEAAGGVLSEASFSFISDLNSQVIGTSTAGALLHFAVTGEPAFGYGSWAVTG